MRAVVSLIVMGRGIGVLVLFLIGCGGSGGGDGPPEPLIGGGGSGGTASGGGGSGGSSGSDGGSAGTSVGGASGAGGSAGAPALGPGCPTEPEAVLVWSKLAGTHPMEVLALGTGSDTYWTVNQTYDVVVDTSDCSVIFHTNDNGTQVCKWTGTQNLNFAAETVAGITYTIHIQEEGDQLESDSNVCELNFRIDLNKMGLSGFGLPHTNLGASFDSPGGTPDP